MAEEGWNTVSRKRRRTVNGAQRKYKRLDIAGRSYYNDCEREVTYFFSQFPDNHGAKDMLRIFSLYGKAMEVVIPPKRDKYGRRFGFVRFRDVKDFEFFATKLDNIIIGATKIHVNIPRFPRERFIEKQSSGHAKSTMPHERREQRSHQSAEGERVDDPKGKKKVYEGEMEGISEKVSVKGKEGEVGYGKGNEVRKEDYGAHKPKVDATRRFAKNGRWGRRPRKDAF